MPPLRPPSESGSDSESGAPETVSLSQSKKLTKHQNAEIWKAGALARQKIKAKNREKDQKLKERAALNKKDDKVVSLKKGKGKQAVDDEGEGNDGGGTIDEDVEARMLRAMKGAEGEGDEGEEEESDLDNDEGFAEFQEDLSFDDAAMDEDGDSAKDSDDYDGETSEDEDMEHVASDSDDDAARATIPEQPKNTVNYLPDEVFKAAFSQAAKPNPSQSKKKDLLSAKQKKKPKRSGPKDVIVGSKTIRTLASTTRPISANAAVPSSKINKFLDRTLALKGQRPIPGKGWERRPANIGVLRRSGPPAHFVRRR